MQQDSKWYTEGYMEASGAYCEGNYAEALQRFTALVEQGNAAAAAYLAELYLRGEGVEADGDKAVALLEQSMNAGYATAAYNLGAIFYSGHHGVARDLERSKRYFLRAKQLDVNLSVDLFFHGT